MDPNLEADPVLLHYSTLNGQGARERLLGGEEAGAVDGSKGVEKVAPWLAEALKPLLHPEQNPSGVFTAEAFFASAAAVVLGERGGGGGGGGGGAGRQGLSAAQELEVTMVMARLMDLHIIEHPLSPSDGGDGGVGDGRGWGARDDADL
jgi:hypothetical protein